MITRWLTTIARAALAHPVAILFGALVAPLVLSLHALTVPLDFSFAGLMDRSHPEVERYFAASQRYGLGGAIPILLEGPEDVLDEGVLAVELAADDVDGVDSVWTGPPETWLAARAPFFVDRDTFDAWMELARRPGDPGTLERLRARIDAFEDRHWPVPPEGTRLVVVHLERDSFELALDADEFPRLRAAVRGAVESLGVNADFSGMSAIITEEQEATISRMRVLGGVSLLLVLLVFRSIEKRTAMLATVIAPMVLSFGCMLGILGFFVGEFTIMESVFGILIFGIGIDFAIHLMLRLREEQRRGADFNTSLERAIAGTGRGLVAGAATTCGAFFVLSFAPEPVFQRLGLAGGIGLGLCLVFLCILLPAQWVLLERRGGPRHGAPSPPWDRAIGRLCRSAIARPRATLALTGLCIAVASLGLPELRYETNLEKVFSREIEAVETARRIHDLYGRDPSPWLVAVSGVDRAREVEAAFADAPLFASSESAAMLFPPDSSERMDRLASIAPELARTIRAEETRLRSLATEEAETIRESLDLLSVLLRSATTEPPSLGSLPSSLDERWIGPDGELLVYAFVDEPVLDSAVAARERAVAQAIDPKATSMNVIFEVLIGTDRPWMPPMFAAVIALIVVILYLDLREVRLVVLALLPVTSAGVVTLGVLGLVGFAFNTVTLVAVPLFLGLGVDDGIHIVHRMLEEPARPIDRVVESVGSSIAMTTLTTCASVGTLLLTRHPGIESIAVLLLVGLPLSLLASITLLPAVASSRARESESVSAIRPS